MPGAFQIMTFAVLGVLLVADLTLVVHRPHVPSIRECMWWVGLYLVLALVFAGVLVPVAGHATAGAFVAGWLTEYSLSVDNLFVLVIIMRRFAVPTGNQQKVLLIGIIVSLLLRGGFILLGAAAVARFTWTYYLFGVLLVYTAVHLARHPHDGGDGEYTENVLTRRARRVLPIAPAYDGARLSSRAGGSRMLTPMVVVLVAIGTTDLFFALDSIPAILGLTKDPFIVFTATIFALMGLRQLYFLLGGLLDRLRYLSLGLSVILAFIGVKLVLEALRTNELAFLDGGDPLQGVPVVPIWLSLLVILVVLGVTTVASLLRSRRRPVVAATHGAAGGGDPRAPHGAGPGSSTR